MIGQRKIFKVHKNVAIFDTHYNSMDYTRQLFSNMNSNQLMHNSQASCAMSHTNIATVRWVGSLRTSVRY